MQVLNDNCVQWAEIALPWTDSPINSQPPKSKIAGALSAHFGKPDMSLHDPNSLMYENTCLDSTEVEKTPLTGFQPPSELPAPTMENSPTNLSPLLKNTAAAPVEDVVKGMLEESIERKPKEVSKQGWEGCCKWRVLW